MNLCDMTPHIRFASKIHCAAQGSSVKVTDCRIFYVTAGEAVLSIDGQDYLLRPHCLFYCCAGSRYSINTPTGFDPICINFDLSQRHSSDILPYPPRSDHWDTMPIHFDEIDNSAFLNSHFYMEQASSFYNSILCIVEEFSTKEPYFQPLCGSLLKELLIRLHRPSIDTIPKKIQQVKDYIDTHYATELNNSQLAAMVGYHEIYLNRIFLACLGMNLHEYLLNVRLNRASYLILNTDLPLNAVSEQTGFHSYPHFSSSFRKHFGFPPAQYRKNHRTEI